MNAPDRSFIRPSALPKLALCGKYRGEKDAGEAANRGTRLDVVFRAMIRTFDMSVFEAMSQMSGVSEAEQDVIKWAVKTAVALAGGKPLCADENELRIEAEGMTGTADLLCADAGWSADLKTGMKRNYREQQAAYALGFMDRFFVDEWTVYLLYCDSQEVETLRFTWDEATECIRAALALYNGDDPPQVNEYCSWCASRFECPARRESLGLLPDFRAIDLEKAESGRLADFVRAAKVVEDFSEQARAVICERVIKGEKILGVSLVSGRVSKIVKPEDLVSLVASMTAEEIVNAYGSMSAEKARELLGKAFHDSIISEARGSAYVTIRAKK